MALYYIGEADAYESEENISHTSSYPIELVSEEPSITPIIGIEQWLLLKHGNVTDVI